MQKRKIIGLILLTIILIAVNGVIMITEAGKELEGHTHSYTWNTSGSTHYQKCSGCGDTKSSHSAGEWKIEGNMHVQKCTWVGCPKHTNGNSHSPNWDYETLLSDNLDGATHTVGCSKCTINKVENHTAGNTYVYTSDAHYKTCTKCGGKTSLDRHSFDTSHICTTCGYKYNHGNNYTVNGKQYSYTTHRFENFSNSAQCSVCGTFAQLSGNLADLPWWTEYTPGDPGNKQWSGRNWYYHYKWCC